jgi:beta-glucanase (GH16 family)
MKFITILLLFIGVSNSAFCQVLVDDFDSTRTAYYGYKDGTLSVATNPAVAGINTSAQVGMYIRNASAQYDVMRIQVSGYFNNVIDYVTGTRTLTMKVYSPRAGIPVQLSFEDTNRTNSTNYPTGRYLVVTDTTRTSNQWELLTFRFNNQPDNTTSPLGINTILLSFNLNSYTGDTYYFDDVKVAEFTQFKLVFNDEFSGNAIDASKWNVNVVETSFNNELQYYTARTQNVSVSNGSLNLTGRRESFGRQQYTSGKVTNNGLGSIKYGRVKVRAKVPSGQGLWPAIWMMPDDAAYGGWPASGEIDIMENLGNNTRTVYSTIHFTDPNHQYITRSNQGSSVDYSADFHIYEVAWTPTRINFLVDSVCISSTEKARPFDQRFYLILNLAVGGDWPGNPNGSTPFPSTFQVDYVRIYSDRVICNAPPRPVISASGPINFCNAGTVTLTAPAASNYIWNTGDTTRSITTSRLAAYSVQIVNNSCTSAISPEVVLTMDTIPATPQITTSGPLSFCTGGSITLTSSSPTGNQWSTGATSRSIIVSRSGRVRLFVLNRNCISSASSVDISVNLATTSTLNDTIQIGATYQFHTRNLTQAGTYFDTIVNTYGCDSIITLHLAIQPLSVRNKTLSKLRIYPNPAYNTISIQVDSPTEIKLINTLGQIVLIQTVAEKPLINISTIPTGIYTLMADGYKTEKIVIRK